MSGTAVKAANAYFTFNNVNLTDSYASEVTISESAEEIDASTLGDNWKQFLQGQAEAGFTVSGIWHRGTAVTDLDPVLHAAVNDGGTLLFEFCPAGSTQNYPMYEGNAFATGYEISGAVGGVVGFTLGLKSAGSVTLTTVA